jgi:LCP family protein required for cell wall assembly
MTRFQKATLSFLTVVAIGLFVLVFRLYSGLFQQPLGAPLQISTVTPIQLPATWTPDPNATSTPVQVLNPISPTRTASVTALCGAPPLMNILLIGSDARSDSYNYGLADMIRLARVDFVNARVTILEFPRDMWVVIPDVADNLNGQDHEKLNQAYLYGNPGFNYTDDPARGPGLLARTLALNFGTQIDHYAAVNMRTFVNVVNALGGIDVYLPDAVDGRTADDMNNRLVFRSGTLHLDGDRALTLARIRIKGGFARGENQNRVLCALRAKLASPSVIKEVPELIESFKDNVQTDLTPAQITQLACIGAQIKPGDIHFADFPEALFVTTREYDPVFGKNISIVKADFEILREYVAQFHAGTWPVASSTSEGPGEEVPFCP